MFNLFKKKKPVDEVEDFLSRNVDKISASMPKAQTPFRMEINVDADNLTEEERTVLHMASRILAARVATIQVTSEAQVRECARESLVFAAVLIEEMRRGQRR